VIGGREKSTIGLNSLQNTTFRIALPGTTLSDGFGEQSHQRPEPAAVSIPYRTQRKIREAIFYEIDRA